MAKTKAGKSVVQASEFNDYSLNEYIKDSLSIPIGVFYKSSNVQAIQDAVNYMKTQRFGSVIVPPNNEYNLLILQSCINKNKQVVVNVTYYNYRPPINSETRPYTSERWEVGDRVVNLDTASSSAEGWVCTKAGTPGEWKATSYIRNWASQVETVDELPDPSVLMQGRQLLCPDDRGVIYCYICTTNEEGEYVWLRQNNLDSKDVYSRVDDLFNKKFSGNVLKSMKGLLVNPLLEDLDNPGLPENVTHHFQPYEVPKASNTIEGTVKLSKSVGVDSNHSLSLFNQVRRNTSYVVGDLLIHPDMPKSKVLECVKSGTTGASDNNLYSAIGIDHVDNWQISDGTCIFSIYDNRWESRKSRIVDLVYPVGSIYMNTTDVNPATLFGGTWVRYAEGQVLVGASLSTPLGNSGGISSYRLSVDQLPEHTHSISISESGGHIHKTRFMNDNYDNSGGGGTGLTRDGSSTYIEHTDQMLSAGQHTHNVTLGTTGKGKTIDNMPPYIVVTIWRRTA